jgi:hypothetical protein
MLLADVSTEAFAAALGWGMSTAYRKINGAVAFTVKEMEQTIQLLHLDLATAAEIFFTTDFS